MKSLTWIFRAAFTLVVYFLCAGSAFTQKVNTDWDQEAKFSYYKTYAWLESKHPAQSDVLNRCVVENIEKQMTAKGFKKVTDAPDVFVVYTAGVKQRVSAGQGYDPATPSEPTRGTLVIDLVDARTATLVWRGSAMDVLSNNSENNIQKIVKATAKVFKNYPPQAKK
ncbi:MAG TPA: DUF4136 domain-containing protein [Candidatus Sulfotelmatobacter sp.]|nr:DUF4136 domain-containing protein [Candidatus Sulfotelmatobacter sp.]